VDDLTVGQPFEGIDIIERFPSRKNAVYLAERDGKRVVLKLFENGRCRNERDIIELSRQSGILVPEVLEATDNALLLEFIPGRTVNDYLETDRMDETVMEVAAWLAGFHRAFRSGDKVRIKSDAIFKNFIVSDYVYGLDFELSRIGMPEEDIGEAMAYLLDTDPMFTEKKFDMCHSFIARYEKGSRIRLCDIEKYIASSLREAADFRPSQKEQLLKRAKDIGASRCFTLASCE
jgi:tRNA A-37 threonylcarbamoyl transferase component Bud32